MDRRPDDNSRSTSPLIRFLHRLEDGILVSLLLTMIGLAVFQILLRNIFESGITWGDPLIRVLVLWIGLVGAMVASRTDNHIRIDVISRYLPQGLKPYVNLVTPGFTALVCGTMAWYSFQFVRWEYADGLTAFAGVPAWLCESIMPIGFGIMALRYLIFCFTGIFKLEKGAS